MRTSLLVLLGLVFLSACDRNRPGGNLREIEDAVAPVKGPCVTFEPTAALHLNGVPRHMTLNGSALYVFLNEYGLTTLDLADAARPKIASHLEGKSGLVTPGTHRYFSGIVDGKRLLVADRYHGLATLSLADPLHPRYVSTVRVPGNQPAHLAKVGGNIFIAAGGTGLALAADAPGGIAPARVVVNSDFANQSVFYPPHFLLLADNHAGGMKVLDIRDPARPVLAHAFQFSGFCDSIEAFGGFVTIGGRKRGVIALDMSDPARPFILSYFMEGFNTIACQARWGEHRLITGTSLGAIDVFDLKDPRRPLWLGRTALGAPIVCLAVKGDMVYAGVNQVAFTDRARTTGQLRVLSVVEK
ncbi:hypothetical protein LLG95_07150 [bacterium]|nr:hypothetical protein [bacterium]